MFPKESEAHQFDSLDGWNSSIFIPVSARARDIATVLGFYVGVEDSNLGPHV